MKLISLEGSPCSVFPGSFSFISQNATSSRHKALFWNIETFLENSIKFRFFFYVILYPYRDLTRFSL